MSIFGDHKGVFDVIRPRRIHLTFGVRRRGVTLIGAVLFIAVALGVIIGGLVFYQQASTAAMTRNTIQQLTAYGSEIRALCERTSPDDCLAFSLFFR
ncbi:MAG: hypothetical protein JKP97_08670 [Rhodobacteraceae bacterium]|nr:hypothetical protein [Paracoccaceae bacterium]